MTKGTSQLWAKITSALFSKVDDAFLDSFRLPGGANSRLAAWDPFDRSMRYYKFFLFNIARRKPREFFDAYQKLGNTRTGRPVTVSVVGCHVDIDYLFALEEYFFLMEHLSLNSLKKVVEIGAGFGRTCHVMLSLIGSIEEYTIVDLPEILELSKAYLKKVIPDHFDRIIFIENTDLKAWHARKSDLVINIDSFQEMTVNVIDEYMDKLIAFTSAFYCKNPTGKYKPECVGLSGLSPDQLLDVYTLGLSQEVFDLFDEAELSLASQRYLAAYQPKGNWKLIANAPMEMFPYLHHALYARQGGIS